MPTTPSAVPGATLVPGSPSASPGGPILTPSALSYPVDILPTVSGYSLGWNGTRGRYGFQYGSALYLFLCRDSYSSPTPGDYKVHALKSTDRGLTWTEQDSAGAPSASIITDPGGVATVLTVARDGATAWVLTPIMDTGYAFLGMAACPFNLTSDTWGSQTNYAAPVPGFVANDSSASPTGGSRLLVLSMAVRGPGDYVVMFSGPPEVSGASSNYVGRVYYATFDGGTWGAATMLPGQTGSDFYFAPVSCIADSAGITHFFLMDNDGNSVGTNLYHVGLSAADVFGAVDTVTSSLEFVNNNVIGQCSEAITFSLSGERLGIAAYVNDDSSSTTQSIRVFHTTAVLEPPSWANTIASQAVDGDPELPAFSFGNVDPAALTLAVVSGTAVVAWTFGEGSRLTTTPAFNSATAFTASWSWSAFGTLFVPSLIPWGPAQISSFGTTSGVGIIGISTNTTPGEPERDSDLAQFFLIGTAAIIPNRVRIPNTVVKL